MWKRLDNFKRFFFLKIEIKYLFLNSIKHNKFITFNQRYKALFFQSKFKKKSINKIKNRCLVSGRSRSIFKKTSYDRFTMRNKLYQSNLPGFKRASW